MKVKQGLMKHTHHLLVFKKHSQIVIINSSSYHGQTKKKQSVKY